MTLPVDKVIKRLQTLHGVGQFSMTPTEEIYKAYDNADIDWVYVAKHQIPIIDLVCGNGTFLLVALDYMRKAGVSDEDAVKLLIGNDIDRTRVRVTRQALLDATGIVCDDNVSCGDIHKLRKRISKNSIIVGEIPSEKTKGGTIQPWHRILVKILDWKCYRYVLMLPHKVWGFARPPLKVGGLSFHNEYMRGKYLYLQTSCKHSPGYGVVALSNQNTTHIANKFAYLPIRNVTENTLEVLELCSASSNRRWDFTSKQKSAYRGYVGDKCIHTKQMARGHSFEFHYDRVAGTAPTKSAKVTATKYITSQKKVDRIFNSELYRFYDYIFGRSDEHSASCLNSLPWLDPKFLWDDDSIYEQLGIPVRLQHHIKAVL